ncbi:MAG: CDP-alcohol phosphatidyltransferase family protein [Polyangiales bacterium]|nr:CDP-alcohol phosphatidyltransferase family protein [Sandaracinus sp.]
MSQPPERRLLARPSWVDTFETQLAHRSPLDADALSWLKLALSPFVALALFAPEPLALPLFLGAYSVVAALDYLDGVVARGRDATTGFGRVLDRLTDLPLLVILGAVGASVVAPGLLIAKLALDVTLLALFVAGLGSTENRVRTALTHLSLVALVLLARGEAPEVVTSENVERLVAGSVVFSSAVALHNLRALESVRFVGRAMLRRLADALSVANLLCGVLSMICAARGALDHSVALLVGSAIFDGLDGAAARRFGGSRFGVLADDLADGVAYGVAPGFALAVTLPGATGTFVGVAFAVFVISRLVYFTRTIGQVDPAYFRGAPSTVGATITVTSLALFPGDPLLVGVLVGGSMALMTAFDLRFRHLGRAARALVPLVLPILGLAVVLGLRFGARGPIALLLASTVGYALLPAMSHLRRVLRP